MKITDDMLTGWFPGDVKPIRRGLYIVRKFPHLDWLYWRYWDGDFWRTGITYECGAPDTRVARGLSEASIQNVQWRGLKEKHHG
jgi:hypothetical protein